MFRIILLAFLLTHLVSLAAQDQKFSTEINEVKIYLQGAEIIRSKTLNLNAGTHQLVFTGLSPVINPKSVQVTASGDATILSISSKSNVLEAVEENAKMTALKDSIELVEVALQDINDQKYVLENERKVIENNKAFNSNVDAVDLAKLQTTTDYYRTRLLEIQRAISKLNREGKEQNKSLERLRQQQQEENFFRRPTSEVEVIVNTKTTLSTSLKLRYIVNQTGWSPIYDLQADNLSEPINLNYRALAFNNTGIDWEEVKIILSTDDPNKSSAKPALRPWVLKDQNSINTYAYNRNQKNSKGRLDLQSSQNMVRPPATYQHDLDPNVHYDKKREQDDFAPQIRFEEIEVSQLSTNFEIEDQYTIPSDSRPYSIEITNYNLNSTYRHYAIPQVERAAYLLSEITGWENLDLIAGPVNIYRGESYVGFSNLNPQSFNDTLDLSLGRDNKVLVIKEKQKEFNKRQFIGINQRADFSYQIKVQNNRDQAISLELVDQVPISNNKEIEVTVKNISGANQIENTGELNWNLTLAPKEEKVYLVEYSIKYPKNVRLLFNRTRTLVTPRYF